MKLKVKNTRIQLILGLVILLALGGWGYYRGKIQIPAFLANQRPSPSPSPTPYVYVPPTQWIKIDGNYAVFATKIFLKRDQTEIVMPVKFEKAIAPSWLSVDARPSDNPSQWLVSHPAFINLNWPSINENSVYLYQKQEQYISISNFLKSPPTDKKILIDEQIHKLRPYKNVPADVLRLNTDINQYDFILTTYKVSPMQDLIIPYSNVYDLTYATTNAAGSLNWSFTADPDDDANTVYIGPVSVNYVQYDRSKQK